MIMIQRRRRPFALTTEAAFTIDGVWLIKADFSFRKTAEGPIRALVNQARLLPGKTLASNLLLL